MLALLWVRLMSQKQSKWPMEEGTWWHVFVTLQEKTIRGDDFQHLVMIYYEVTWYSGPTTMSERPCSQQEEYSLNDGKPPHTTCCHSNLLDIETAWNKDIFWSANPSRYIYIITILYSKWHIFVWLTSFAFFLGKILLCSNMLPTVHP